MQNEDSPGKAQRDRYLIEAVDRALTLLELLADNPGLGVTEIAGRMGVSKALAFRLLHTLERRDYVIRDPEHRTSALGYRLLHLADQIDRTDLIVSATHEHLDELARLSREDVNLFVRVGLDSVCVATRPSAHQVRMPPHVGRLGTLHVGGATTVLLAYAPQNIQDTVLAGEMDDADAVDADRSGEAASASRTGPGATGSSSRAAMSTCPASRSACPSGAAATSSLPPSAWPERSTGSRRRRKRIYRALLIDYADQMSRVLGGAELARRAVAARLAMAS